ncbi:TetR/AcrR family transcriptional regulator [Levilactobacillus bambusae]|uniref:HTH tetR-type domain-containing protein n=1 Tax=Levilactobacillus bambusae TaxID=2024736 RepID=A0A2V1N0W3_9LACO|nr:TetR/AcrR family transcriptional regulator [Levilactobacillus bambusae]PWG00016.1 hypothetical protein DCM90_03500 [Levilactobacillus bambusae]
MVKLNLTKPLKLDHRSIQSQAKLYKALCEAFHSDLPFSRLTVKQLCQAASVSRATFYRHHQDITDIIIVQLLRVIGKFEASVDQLSHIDYQSGSRLVVDAIWHNRLLVQLIGWSQCEPQCAQIISGAVLNILLVRQLIPDV